MKRGANDRCASGAMEIETRLVNKMDSCDRPDRLLRQAAGCHPVLIHFYWSFDSVLRQPAAGLDMAPGAGQLSGFHRRQASHGLLTDRFIERLSNFRSFLGVP